MLFHYKVEDSGEDQDDNHDDGLGGTGEIVFKVSNEEEQANKGDLEDVDTGEKLGEGIVEEEAVSIDLVALDVVVIMAVGNPEEGERGRDEDKH